MVGLPIRSETQKVAAPGEPDGLSPWEYTIAELLSDAEYGASKKNLVNLNAGMQTYPNIGPGQDFSGYK